MSIRVVRVVSIALCFALIMSFAGVAFAAPSDTPIQHMEVVASKIFDETSEIDVKASVSNETKLPAKVTIIGASDVTLKSMGTFDSATPNEVKKVSYDKETIENGFIAYTVELTNQNGVNAIFEGPTLANDDSGHIIFGMGWVVASDTDSLVIGAVLPDGFTGVGSGTSLLSTDANGSNIYGQTFLDVKAEETNGSAMALMPAGNGDGQAGEPTDGGDGVFDSLDNITPMQYAIYAIAALLVILVIAVIILLLKSRKSKQDEYFDEDYDGEDDESEETSDFDEDDTPGVDLRF